MSKWISVKDRVPKKDQEVLVWIAHNKSVRIMCLMQGRNKIWYYGGWTLSFDHVSHWMELPAPPKED